MEHLENFNLFITHKTCAVKLNAEEQKKYLLVEAKKQKSIIFDNMHFDVKKITDQYIVINLSTFASRCSKAKSYVQYIFIGENLTIEEEGIDGTSNKYIFCYGNSYNKGDIEELEKIEYAKKCDKVKNTIKSIDKKSCTSNDIIDLIYYLGPDIDYNRGNKIEGILEVITYLTFIQRKDYYDGYDKVINEYLENETIKKLLERYLELC